jgi:pimeloyl-ACP methyl ester carboxylesterase
MERAKLNGVTLEYEVKGSGEPVLLISVGPIADSFLPLLSEKALVERYRLITFRQRRLAHNTNGPAPVSFAEHAADAVALLGHLDVRRTHVAGHSTGAAIALQLAVDRPDIVHTLTLLEPPLVGVPSAGAFFEKVGPALAAYSSGDRDGAMRRFLTVVCSLDWETCCKVIEEHVPGGMAQVMTNENVDNFFASYLPALTAWPFGAHQAASICRPVLSVLGMDTEQLFVDSHELLHSWFPQVEDCRIEGVAHLLHMQRPAPVARGIAEFFACHPMTGDDIIHGPSTSVGRRSAATSMPK